MENGYAPNLKNMQQEILKSKMNFLPSKYNLGDAVEKA
jgi:hypothetical protein